jgi:hypothetical protein
MDFDKVMVYSTGWASGETEDTPALGAGAARHGGASPLSPTKQGVARMRARTMFCASERGLARFSGAPDEHVGSENQGREEKCCDGSISSA